MSELNSQTLGRNGDDREEWQKRRRRRRFWKRLTNDLAVNGRLLYRSGSQPYLLKRKYLGKLGLCCWTSHQAAEASFLDQQGTTWNWSEIGTLDIGYHEIVYFCLISLSMDLKLYTTVILPTTITKSYNTRPDPFPSITQQPSSSPPSPSLHLPYP